MLGQKAGDNSQLLALAEALSWPFERRNLFYRRTELLTNLFAGPTLMGLIRAKSDPLEPPWPELIISAGRRNEPLVRWIQQQAGGPGTVKLVHVGRPWAPIACFDLVITTPQYRLPHLPNVLHNETPLHRVTPERLAAAAAAWAPRLAHLPRPYVMVTLGGQAGPYNFDRENGALLAWHASRMARELGGSLLVTSSARTPAKALAAFEATLDAPAEVYRWRKDATENPYFGFLALADRMIVTCDSMSMLTEACVTRKPVFIFDLLRGEGSHRPPLPADGAVLPVTFAERLRDFNLRALIYRASIHVGPRRLTRDVSIIHKRQVEAGRAVWLGQPWPADRPLAPPLDDVGRAVARVRALFPRLAQPVPRQPEPAAA
ncbi:MAG: ELM1/GtrOC1 family putative glycosyltransferase [Geminicoccaceae bacterium]